MGDGRTIMTVRQRVTTPVTTRVRFPDRLRVVPGA